MGFESETELFADDAFELIFIKNKFLICSSSVQNQKEKNNLK